jgi:HEAT repeat protein
MSLLSRVFPATALGLAVALALALLPSGGGLAPEEGSPETPVERLLERLGHDDFEVREQAARELSVRDDALPAVRRALRSPDPEVRQRAAQILEKLESRRTQRSLQRTAARA